MPGTENFIIEELIIYDDTLFWLCTIKKIKRDKIEKYNYTAKESDPPTHHYLSTWFRKYGSLIRTGLPSLLL